MIREMTTADLPKILPIERECFSDPWTEEMFLESLAVPFIKGLVQEEEGEIVGYLLGSVLFEDAEVANVATAAAHRGKGVASGLMDAFERFAKEGKAQRCLLEVRVGNTPARTLYEKRRYVQIAVRKKYYPDGEDALVMQKTL